MCYGEGEKNQGATIVIVMEICSTFQPTHETIRGSTELVPGSVAALYEREGMIKDTEQVSMQHVTTR